MGFSKPIWFGLVVWYPVCTKSFKTPFLSLFKVGQSRKLAREESERGARRIDSRAVGAGLRRCRARLCLRASPHLCGPRRLSARVRIAPPPPPTVAPTRVPTVYSLPPARVRIGPFSAPVSTCVQLSTPAACVSGRSSPGAARLLLPRHQPRAASCLPARGALRGERASLTSPARGTRRVRLLRGEGRGVST